MEFNYQNFILKTLLFIIKMNDFILILKGFIKNLIQF